MTEIICTVCGVLLESNADEALVDFGLCAACAEELGHVRPQDQPEPDYDDPCFNGDHDWIGGDYADECMVCRLCGLYDC
jgi:hypothetical protein